MDFAPAGSKLIIWDIQRREQSDDSATVKDIDLRLIWVMAIQKSQAADDEQPKTTMNWNEGTSCQPRDRTGSLPDVQAPGEHWTTVLDSSCSFPPELFHVVMLNLIKNPNITSSHLFRADIFYDSGEASDGCGHRHDLYKHLKLESRPINVLLPEYSLTRTLVRQLVPRNPQLDRPLVQTCHFYQNNDDHQEINVIMYIPHVQKPEEMPFYHPGVSKLAFAHFWNHGSCADPQGRISISYNLFPDSILNNKLFRTALRLLETVHKHGQGQLAGYEKRVHHDQIIPQKRYQDTYSRLKTKYGKRLVDSWVEVTDPGKHVFEDIAIAAFLIELWKDMYGDAESFPGFVDIGCGNGVLSFILLSEGLRGSGFDARQRKTWEIFPDDIRANLHAKILVPEILHGKKDGWHDGVFEPGTFIVSNHADELTAWTPLLAYLNNSSFIAIPCCSHDLSGARFRAPPATKFMRNRSQLKGEGQAVEGAARLPQQQRPPTPPATGGGKDPMAIQAPSKHAAETGSLQRTLVQKKMASAYSTLCSYVGSLSEEVGFEAEKEILRIPSTRNTCILGRRRKFAAECKLDRRKDVVAELVERELGRDIAHVAEEWLGRAEKIAQKPGSGH